MQTYEVPVEEIVSRRVVHRIAARDEAHACEIARSLEGSATTNVTHEEVMRKIVSSGEIRLGAPGDTRPLARITSISGMPIEAISEKVLPVTIGHMVIDTQSPVATWKGKTIKLTLCQYRMLLEMALRVGEVVDREELLAASDGVDKMVLDRNIDTRIRRIRQSFKAIDPALDPIETSYGTGYRLSAEALGAAAPAARGSDASLVIDERQHQCWFCGVAMQLPRGPFELLVAMARRPNMLMDTGLIVKHACYNLGQESDGYGAARSVLKTIRRKARDISPDVPLLETAYGIGTRIHPDIDVTLVTRDGQ